MYRITCYGIRILQNADGSVNQSKFTSIAFNVHNVQKVFLVDKELIKLLRVQLQQTQARPSTMCV